MEGPSAVFAVVAPVTITALIIFACTRKSGGQHVTDVKEEEYAQLPPEVQVLRYSSKEFNKSYGKMFNRIMLGMLAYTVLCILALTIFPEGGPDILLQFIAMPRLFLIFIGLPATYCFKISRKRLFNQNELRIVDGTIWFRKVKQAGYDGGIIVNMVYDYKIYEIKSVSTIEEGKRDYILYGEIHETHHYNNMKKSTVLVPSVKIPKAYEDMECLLDMIT